jgi:hypothetical protein
VMRLESRPIPAANITKSSMRPPLPLSLSR